MGKGKPRLPEARPGQVGVARRRIKALRTVKHHVRVAGGSAQPIDVVLPDEGVRICGR